MMAVHPEKDHSLPALLIIAIVSSLVSTSHHGVVCTSISVQLKIPVQLRCARLPSFVSWLKRICGPSSCLAGKMVHESMC